MWTPLRLAVLLLLLAPGLLGCAGLYPQPDDSGLMGATKIATRVVIGIPTLGISEALIGTNARHRQRLAYVRGLTARYEEARSEVGAAQTREEWEQAMLRYEAAETDVRRYRSQLAASERTSLAIEPFHTIRTVRARRDAALLPPLDPPVAAGTSFPKVLAEPQRPVAAPGHAAPGRRPAGW